MTIDIGPTGIWSGFFDVHSSSAVQDACRQIEEMGFPTVWIPEAVRRAEDFPAGIRPCWRSPTRVSFSKSWLMRAIWFAIQAWLELEYPQRRFEVRSLESRTQSSQRFWSVVLIPRRLDTL